METSQQKEANDLEHVGPACDCEMIEDDLGTDNVNKNASDSSREVSHVQLGEPAIDLEAGGGDADTEQPPKSKTQDSESK